MRVLSEAQPIDALRSADARYAKRGPESECDRPAKRMKSGPSTKYHLFAASSPSLNEVEVPQPLKAEATKLVQRFLNDSSMRPGSANCVAQQLKRKGSTWKPKKHTRVIACQDCVKANRPCIIAETDGKFAILLLPEKLRQGTEEDSVRNYRVSA